MPPRNLPTSQPIGRLTEPVTFLTAEPPDVSVTSLTSENTTAAAVTAVAHGLRSGDYVTIRGASPIGYNAESRQVVVTGPREFEYAMPAGLVSPATGAITVRFVSDAQGGQPDNWFSIGQAFAFIEPLNAAERLIVSTVAAVINYRAVIHYRTGIKASMKLEWQRYQEQAPRQLEIFGVYPHPAPAYSRRFLVIECGELSA